MPELKSPPMTPSKRSSKVTNGAMRRGDRDDAIAFDPLISILAAFNALPASDRETMFENFHRAATDKDLRQLLDTISDWAATAELYANPSFRKEFNEAQDGRQEVAEWLSGKHE